MFRETVFFKVKLSPCAAERFERNCVEKLLPNIVPMLQAIICDICGPFTAEIDEAAAKKIRDDARRVWIVCRVSVYDRRDEFGTCHWRRHKRSQWETRRTVFLRCLAHFWGPFRLVDPLPSLWGKAYYCRRVPADIRGKYCTPGCWEDEGDLRMYCTEDEQSEDAPALEPDAEQK